MKERLDLDALLVPGRSGQFDILVDGELVASREGNVILRLLGGGWPDPEDIVAAIDERLAAEE